MDATIKAILGTGSSYSLQVHMETIRFSEETRPNETKIQL